MDFARQFMGEIDKNGAKNTDHAAAEQIEILPTEAPARLVIRSLLSDRRWVFEEVLWVKGATNHLSRDELQEAVADAKGIASERVDVCFFTEEDLSHPLLQGDAGPLGAAGDSKGDVVCIWKTKYEPAAFKQYSRKWLKIKKKIDSLPARWYLVTAIRKDGLSNHAETASEVDESEKRDELALIEAEPDEWMPPNYEFLDAKKGRKDDRKKKY
jgi:hypothetical protein